MVALGLWPYFVELLHSEHSGRRLIYFVATWLLFGFGGGALVLFVGERLKLLPSSEKLDRDAEPVSLFAKDDRVEKR